MCDPRIPPAAEGTSSQRVETAIEPSSETRLTEARNPRTMQIGGASASEIVRLIQAEDRRVADAVEAEAPAIARLIDEVARRLRNGGRLLYVGAGTSGRLGVLDAAECPPTFGTDPGQVRGIIAGGLAALVRSREGVEDDREAGRAAIREQKVGERDFVLGIATSGTTPFVHAGLEEAAMRGAGLGFLSCTPPPERMRELADILVTPLVGPEAVTGSTRMKAGTATKLILNALTTGVMIRLGKVHENLMVDLQAVSLKLVDRSLRIVREGCGVVTEEARRLLLAAGGSAKTAIVMGRLRTGRALAERLLDASDGFLSRALERCVPGEPIPLWALYGEEPSEARVLRLLERLSAAPGRVEEAVREAGRASGPPDAASWEGEGASSAPLRRGWRPAQHLSHLVRFETEAVRPRLEAMMRRDEPHLESWEPPPEQDAGPAAITDLFSRFAAERARTLAELPAQAELPALRAWIGEERCSAYQFLCGIAQHDQAHATRIRERIHPALLTPLPENGA